MHGEVPAEELSADVLSAVERNIPAATRHFVEFAATVARAPEQVREQPRRTEPAESLSPAHHQGSGICCVRKRMDYNWSSA